MTREAMHSKTPLILSDAWRTVDGAPALLKLDALQPAGSFKQRGIGHFIAARAADGVRTIVCASGGNAGFAAAHAARTLGLGAQIVVPETTSAEARDAIAALGADVVVHGADFDAAAAHAADLASASGGALVHPFDHPLVWEGNSTLVDEIVEAHVPFDCIIASVGGGGLLAGVLEGLARHGRMDVAVVAAETEGADALSQAIGSGGPVTLPAITSIATSLGARRVADRAFELAAAHPVKPVVVTDRQAVEATLRFADTNRILVEPACGAALAALATPTLAPYRNPVVIVCGGIGVSLARLAGWRAAFGL